GGVGIVGARVVEGRHLDEAGGHVLGGRNGRGGGDKIVLVDGGGAGGGDAAAAGFGDADGDGEGAVNIGVGLTAEDGIAAGGAGDRAGGGGAVAPADDGAELGGDVGPRVTEGGDRDIGQGNVLRGRDGDAGGAQVVL